MKRVGVVIALVVSGSVVWGTRDDEYELAEFVARQFEDKLLQKKITFRFNAAPLQDVVEFLGATAGINLVVDPGITGETGNLSYVDRGVGDILLEICERHEPRLAVMKQRSVWRVMPYEKALILARSLQRESLASRVFSLQHARCDEMLKSKIESWWQRFCKQCPVEGSYCMVDTESKKIFAYATEKHLHALGLFLKEIDYPVAQVRIDALVAEVDNSYEQQWGINWCGVYDHQATNQRGFSFLGINGSGAGSDHFALNLFSKSATLKIPFLFGTDLGMQRVMIELRAAQAEAKARILLSPSVLTSHSETAEILIGKSIPIKTVTEDVIQGKLRNVQTVNYKEVGTMLNVRPLVSPDRKSVALEIWVEESLVTDSVASDHAPTIKTIRTKNKLVLRSGQTTVIGGLMLNRDESSSSGIPFLSSIPIIGALFRSERHAREESQLLIFITPTIVV